MKLYAILPDQQIPFHDRRLHELVLRWLDTNKPHGLIFPGDVIDLPSLSTHDWNPDIVAEPYTHTGRSLQETRTYLGECVQACDPTECMLIDGNHEHRWLRNLIKKNPELVTVVGGLLGELMGLDELGIRHITNYPHGKLWVGDKLAIMHGWLAKKGSGMTARATLEHLGHSIGVGHTHRQALVFHTHYPKKGPETQVAFEAGTLAQLEGLGYAVSPDWQQGFATVRLHDDGTFQVGLATYTAGMLWWEDQQYKAGRARGVRVAA